MVQSSCHCGAVKLEIAQAPGIVKECNCSICRRYGTLWAYYSPKDVRIESQGTDIYMWGDKDIEFHRCRNCGCVTHWAPADKTRDRMGINAWLLEPAVLATANVQFTDGASM